MQCLVLPSCIITGFFQELCVVRYMLALLSRKKIISKIQSKKLAQNCTLPISCKKKKQINIHFLNGTYNPFKRNITSDKGKSRASSELYYLAKKKEKLCKDTCISSTHTHCVLCYSAQDTCTPWSRDFCRGPNHCSLVGRALGGSAVRAGLARELG